MVINGVLICTFAHRLYIYQNNLQLLNTTIMLRWTAVFFIIAIIAGLLGFTGIAAGAASIAKIIFFVFLALLVISAILGFTSNRK
jgi:uncharacterized membrane protein YtjA (UPF0391 family)